MKYTKSNLGQPFVITPDDFIAFDGTPPEEFISKYSAKKCRILSIGKYAPE